MPVFKVHDKEQQGSMLALKLPDGKFWRAKYMPDKNLRKYLIAIGTEFMRLEERFNYAGDQFNINTTTDLIDEFEREYGISTSCFANTPAGSLQQRIDNILTIIGANGVSTEAQFEALAVILGLTDIDVSAGLAPENAGLSFDDTQARFTIVVRRPATGGFPYQFPMKFIDPVVTLFECFILQLKPANVRVIFVSIVTDFTDEFSSEFA